MAEFTEVCRLARRLAKSISGGENLKRVDICVSMTDESVKCSDGKLAMPPEELEATIIKWAEEHPEPMYPSWEQWQKANFPTTHDVMHPCAFMKREEVEKVRGVGCGHTSCNVCARSPIPADIAKKLGIKPLDGDTHE